MVINIQNQKKLILNGDWKYLFILDACRFDYFKQNYKDFLKGNLKKTVSSGSTTQEWLINSFSGEVLNDVIYVSGNPWINSKYIRGGFNSNRHFYEVDDVWDWGWNENGVVSPEAMVKGLKKAEKNHPEKRKIIHFLQPHAPYIKLADKGSKFTEKLLRMFFTFLDKAYSIKKSFSEKNGDGSTETNWNMRRRKTTQWISDKFGRKFLANLRKILFLPPTAIWEVMYREGIDNLSKYYTHNLRRGLNGIERCLKFMKEGKAVVTADHGGLVGEKYEEVNKEGKIDQYINYSDNDEEDFIVRYKGEKHLYGHPGNCDIPILKNVPWFEIEK